MDQTSQPASAAAAVLHDLALQRYAMRLGADYFIHLAGALSEMFDGNLLTGLVFLTIAQGSVQHLNRPAQFNAMAVDGVFPDELRRPVSVLGISQFLGLPYETARRHTGRLEKMGYCQKVGGKGVVIPAEILRGPEVQALVRANYGHLRTLLQGLRRGGEAMLPPQDPRWTRPGE
ncbi:hypothetical protein [Phenylobacterium sp.]|uniref:hypothetical protein n=1 Tax=Phenylobacterium sp. TaxID=1871053 RepID=UPI002730515F|nr:hypothetical protein [Phenylobacterium sp.]MDP1872703.1 hypothetical protein [Phenylobacterium sp.]